MNNHIKNGSSSSFWKKKQEKYSSLKNLSSAILCNAIIACWNGIPLHYIANANFLVGQPLHIYYKGPITHLRKVYLN